MDAGPFYKNPAVRADRSDAERVLRALQRAGVLDPSRTVARADAVTIPVQWRPDLPALVATLGAALVDEPDLAAREERVSPRERVLALLPQALAPLVPDKWELLGDVLVLRVSDELRPHAREVAAAFAEVLGAKSVVEDVAGVSGELREMRGALLHGDDPVTTHVENGVKYRLDASRIMFSSGNVAERARAASLPARGETVVDMFAGIGYFTLPIAMRSGAACVIAIEKNPLSFQYLEENVRLNRIEGVVETWRGDNRDFPRDGIADRVLMGYFPGTAKFLPKALQLLKPQGGVIHYHDTAHERSWKEEMTQALLSAARACGRVVQIQEARVVKSHSPGVVHAVLVARVAS